MKWNLLIENTLHHRPNYMFYFFQMNTFSGVQQLVPGMMLGDEIIFHTVDQGPSMSMVRIFF